MRKLQRNETRPDRPHPDALLTTKDIAGLLRVHPKHVYRLLRAGLPGHRVGGEWRFVASEVMSWTGAPEQPVPRVSPTPPVDASGAGAGSDLGPPPLLATNGDLSVEYLLARLTSSGVPLFGHVQADRGAALEMLKRGDVLAAGCHGNDVPTALDEHRLAFLYIVDRQVGLAMRPGVRVQNLRQVSRWRLASRPVTAGVRAHLDEHLRREGVDPDIVHSRATVMPSHRDVVCAVVRGDADVGLASVAWANRVGLECMALCQESYGLVMRASLLGDPRVIRLCEMAQSHDFRREVGSVPGYRTPQTGSISYQAPARAVSVVKPGRSTSRRSS